MNIGNGLKAIINVGFWVWIALGVLVIFAGFNHYSSGKSPSMIYVGIIFGIVTPIIIRQVIFYIINSFK